MPGFQKLTAEGDAASDAVFGFDVAVSGDGETIAVGAGNEGGESSGGGAGAVYIFTRSGATWVRQARIVPDFVGFTTSGFGAAVALSEDGNTLAVSNVVLHQGFDDPNTPVVSVWVRVDGEWTREFTAGDPSGAFQSLFGASIALSADGNTLLVGDLGFAQDEDAEAEGFPGDIDGAAYVFFRDEGGWADQSGRLYPADDIPEFPIGDPELENFFHYPPGFGSGVALSADGDWALIGAVNYVSEEGHDATFGGGHGNLFPTSAGGAFWVYRRAGGSWSKEAGPETGGRVAGDTNTSGGGWGLELSISGDGLVATASGSPHGLGVGTDTEEPSLYVYSRTEPDGAFAFEQTLFSNPSWPSDGVVNRAALAYDGSLLLLGQWRSQNRVPKPLGLGEGTPAYLFSHDPELAESRVLAPGDVVGEADFGSGVAISYNGSVLVIGGQDDDNQGAAWVFLIPAPLSVSIGSRFPRT